MHNTRLLCLRHLHRHEPRALDALKKRSLHAEPNELKAGERVFDILINGRLVEEKFDIVREAGQPRTTVIREFRSVLLGDELELLCCLAPPVRTHCIASSRQLPLLLLRLYA